MRLAPPEDPCHLGGFSPRSGLYLRKAAELTNALPALAGFKTRPRITWLLQHGHRTGVGNYLANEALGRLRLSPFVPCRNEGEALHILHTCQQLARKSYRLGGTSFGIRYFRLDGSEGTFSNQLRFYKNPTVQRTLLGNRPVYTTFRLRAPAMKRKP